MGGMQTFHHELLKRKMSEVKPPFIGNCLSYDGNSVQIEAKERGITVIEDFTDGF